MHLSFGNPTGMGPRDCQITSGIREYQKYLNQTVLLELRNETGYLYDCVVGVLNSRLLRHLALVIIVILVIIANVIA